MIGEIGYNKGNEKVRPRAVNTGRVTQRSRSPMSDLIITPTKVCSKCGVEKPATREYFYSNKSYKDRLSHQCIECQKAYNVAYYKKTAERQREASKNWRANNREKHRASVKLWQRDNVEKRRKIALKTARKRREKFREYSREYYLTHKRDPYKVCAISHRYRARKRNLPDTFTDNDWNYALGYFHGCCAYCSRQRDFWNPLHMEHFIPLTAIDCPGTVVTNIIPACSHCNLSKNDKPAIDWLKEKFGSRKAKKIIERIQAYFVSVGKTS
jgi:hypothetical protein